MGSETAMVDKIVSISHVACYVIEIENLEAFFIWSLYRTYCFIPEIGWKRFL